MRGMSLLLVTLAVGCGSTGVCEWTDIEGPMFCTEDAQGECPVSDNGLSGDYISDGSTCADLGYTVECEGYPGVYYADESNCPVD